jgi:alkylhydroperoxidase family enzyme
MAGNYPEQMPSRDRAMADYVTKLTLQPVSIGAEDIEILRSHDFSDHAIVEINLAAAYMNLVNRIALGLGVELEENLALFHR